MAFIDFTYRNRCQDLWIREKEYALSLKKEEKEDISSKIRLWLTIMDILFTKQPIRKEKEL